MQKCPRILVLDRLDADLGSQVVFTAIVELLGRAAEAEGVDLAIDQSRIDALPLRESTLETINTSYDLVVLAGDGLFAHDPRRPTESGWAFDAPIELIERLEVPLAILAAGYDAPSFTPDRLFEVAGDHLARTARRADVFTLRDDEAADRFDDELDLEIEVSGPLELAVEPAPFRLDAVDASRRPIALSLQLDTANEVLPFPYQARLETFIRAVTDSLDHFAREQNRQIVFLPHTMTPIDVELSALLQVRLPEESLVLAHHEVPGLYAPTEIHRAGTLASIYASMDAVIAHRPTSVALPFAVGTPAVSFVSTPGSFMLHDSLGLPAELAIDLRRFDEEVTVPRIVGAVSRARWAGIDEHVAAHVSEVRESLAAAATRAVRLAIACRSNRRAPLDRVASF